MICTNITSGVEPAALGCAIGAVLAELAITVLPVARNALAVMFVVAGCCALAAAACVAVERRLHGLRAAALSCVPGVVIFCCCLALAWMAGT